MNATCRQEEAICKNTLKALKYTVIQDAQLAALKEKGIFWKF